MSVPEVSIFLPAGEQSNRVARPSSDGLALLALLFAASLSFGHIFLL